MDYQTRIGHAHLKVSDLERAVAFYTRFLHLHLVEQVGNHYAFLTGGTMHHEIALQNLGAYAMPQNPRSIGLYHVAFEVPDRASLAAAYQRLTEAGVDVAPVDHLISWALYFSDPDGNGLEIYWDTRNEAGGDKLWMGRNVPLQPRELLMALDSTAQPEGNIP